MNSSQAALYQQKILGKNLRQKALALAGLLTWLDYDCPAAEKDAAFAALDPRVQEALNELWEKFYASPKSHGHWTGDPCDSTWIPDDAYTPPNKSYSNIHGLSWSEIKSKHGFKGLRCQRGRFCFEDIAWHKVSLPNFADLVSSANREALHEAAFAALAKQLGKSVDEVKALKESARDHSPMGQKNLAWHEDIDCETLYLVPQEIHGNIIHFGGVAMCQLLRKYKFI